MDNHQNQPQAHASLDPCAAPPPVNSPTKNVDAAPPPVGYPTKDGAAAPPPVHSPTKDVNDRATIPVGTPTKEVYAAPLPVGNPIKDVDAAPQKEESGETVFACLTKITLEWLGEQALGICCGIISEL